MQLQMAGYGPQWASASSQPCLSTVSSNGILLVTNSYDARSRRVRKTTAEATTTFFYDDWNLVEENVEYADGTTATIDYYWGKDLSGTFQGAGGIGGLLYLTVNGAIYIPCYDNNGNVVRYLDSTGSMVAAYVYDAFGNTISQTGTLASFFRHRFSTKYYDVETGLYYYGCRFYCPGLMRWLNRDSLEENGGLNLYAVCSNSLLKQVDPTGQWTWNEDSAISEIREKITEMRQNGYDFAADALSRYLDNQSLNVDMSQYSNEIASNSAWQHSFIKSVVRQLSSVDPDATGRECSIGDTENAARFGANLARMDLNGQYFRAQFSHRFYPSQSMGLFYALFGSRYSYYGQASWKKCFSAKGWGSVTVTSLKTKLRMVTWDRLTYPTGFGRTIFPSYSAAHYLEERQEYASPYIYLEWDEDSAWEIRSWTTATYSGNVVIRK